jgi:hypothetical protein
VAESRPSYWKQPVTWRTVVFGLGPVALLIAAEQVVHLSGNKELVAA